MSAIKVYIGCYKGDFYLLKSCIASIRYWNKEVPVVLLKDYSKGDFDTTALEKAFNVSTVTTRYKKLGGYMKLQPYIEHPDETIFLQDADMVWLGDIIQLLKDVQTDIAIDAYEPENLTAELNDWYFDTKKVQQFYPGYVYPGFVFNCGSIFLKRPVFLEDDFNGIINWREGAAPIHENVFFCEDQGIINFLVAEKYLKSEITITKIGLQISNESAEAKAYSIDALLHKKPRFIIVHWLGRKTGLNSFCTSSHLLRFYERQYYRHFANGYGKMWVARLVRAILHFDTFVYEMCKKIYYIFIPRK